MSATTKITAGETVHYNTRFGQPRTGTATGRTQVSNYGTPMAEVDHDGGVTIWIEIAELTTAS